MAMAKRAGVCNVRVIGVLQTLEIDTSEMLLSHGADLPAYLSTTRGGRKQGKGGTKMGSRGKNNQIA